jgi:tRNA modification GTPase
LPAKGKDIKNRPGFSLTLGWIMDEDGTKIDEVMVGIMRAPHSYTGEDVAEINCHGGSLPIRRCLQRCLEVGLRLAEPGEFTKRAFLNGRLDLDQAEAVIDIIRAKTDRGLQLAVNQLQGNKEYFEKIHEKLLNVNALVEASLDFPDEVGGLDYEDVQAILLGVQVDLDNIIRTGKRNEIYRDGLRVVICGKPNVGKSSLLNALIKQEKAIVTCVPGTTRDVVEDYINVKGIPIQLMDTAGIRMTEDFIEKIGVEKSREVIEQADILIFMIDVAEGVNRDDLDIYSSVKKEKVIVLVNKEDLEEKRISQAELDTLCQGVNVIRGSVINEIGLDELVDTIEKMAISEAIEADGLEITVNMRQKNALQQCQGQIQSALENLEKVPLDCLGVDIWGAMESLGEISGKTTKDEVIDRIFRDFCIGK